MKSIAICLVLIACLESRAQDFRCIPQEGFYFDAKKILNVDSELQHVFIERIDSLFNIKIGYFNTVLDDVNNDGCYFPNSPNLVSQPVVFYGDSITQFHSNGGIEIRIKNLAKKGDSWVMSRLTGGSTIRAKISDVYLSNVYGEVDVIKKISLVTLDSLGDTILTPLNNLFFELSQHHGLVKIPDINSYPNGGYMALYTDCQQKTLSNKEVYDYDIGDEFHYNMYYGDDWTNEVIYMTRKVLNRLDFPNEEMIVYTILEKKLIDQTDHNHNQDPVWKYPFRIEENEVQDTIRDLNEAAIDVFIDRYKKYNQGKTIMDKIIYTSSDSSYLEYLRAFKNTFNLPANVFSGSAYYKYGNCFRPSTFEFTPSFYKVYKGLGETIEYWNSSYLVFGVECTPCMHFRYIKKKNFEWGASIEPLFVEAAENQHKPIIYPNPVSTLLIISHHKEIEAIHLIDGSGQIVLEFSASTPGKQMEMDTSTLSEGTYILKIFTAKGTTSHKVIKLSR